MNTSDKIKKAFGSRLMFAVLICTALSLVGTIMSPVAGRLADRGGRASYEEVLNEAEEEMKKNGADGNEAVDEIFDWLRSEKGKDTVESFAAIFKNSDIYTTVISAVPAVFLVLGYFLIYKGSKTVKTEAAAADAAPQNGDPRVRSDNVKGFAAVKIVMMLRFAVMVLTAVFIPAACILLSTLFLKVKSTYTGSNEEVVKTFASIISAALVISAVFSVVICIFVLIYYFKAMRLFGSLKKASEDDNAPVVIPTYYVVMNYICGALTVLMSLGNLTSISTLPGFLSMMTGGAALILINMILRGLKKDLED